MRIAVESFRGEAPRITARALPENAAQAAVNARLLTGDLEAWRQFTAEKALANYPGTVATIYKLNGVWLSWAGDVDVARGAVAGDTTFRTFLTGPGEYSEPRFTTFALATTGSEPYPVATRPLGVPAPDSAPTLETGLDPSPTTFSIDITDEGDTLDTLWSTSSPVGGAISLVEQDDAIGNPAPSYKLTYGDNRHPGEFPFAHRNFGVGAAAVIQASTDFRIAGGWTNAYLHIGADATGAGAVVVGYRPGSLNILKSSEWGAGITAVIDSVAVAAPAAGVWHRLEGTVTRNADGTATVVARLFTGSALVGTVTATNNFTSGDYCGVSAGDPADGPMSSYFDNVSIQATGSTNYTPTNIATAYVFRFVNDLGQPSAPSMPSATVLRPDGVSVTVTTPTDVPSGISADYGITTKQIFRAATGASGTIYRFVAEIPLATADYVDVLADAQLGDALNSEGWDLPPVDLEGILALPNGVMAGFRRNQLCLSAQNYPHAWPVANRLTVDTDIVAIGNIDTTVVIGTQNFIYLATGTDPGAYSMTKLEVPQACVSKRSLAYLTGIGVVFASPDGLIAVAGNGMVRNVTSSMFTRDQWQAMAPETMQAVAHDDVYFCFYETGPSGVRGGFALDVKPEGFGLVPLSFHATAAFSDPLTDKLFLVLDDVDEPADVYLPLASTAPAPNGATIYEFNAEAGAGHLVYRWRGKLHLLPRPAAFLYCQVKAASYANLVLRLYADGVQFFEHVVTSSEPFTLPMLDDYEAFEVEVLGTSSVRTLQFAEGIEELA